MSIEPDQQHIQRVNRQLETVRLGLNEKNDGWIGLIPNIVNHPELVTITDLTWRAILDKQVIFGKILKSAGLNLDEIREVRRVTDVLSIPLFNGQPLSEPILVDTVARLTNEELKLIGLNERSTNIIRKLIPEEINEQSHK